MPTRPAAKGDGRAKSGWIETRKPSGNTQFADETLPRAAGYRDCTLELRQGAETQQLAQGFFLLDPATGAFALEEISRGFHWKMSMDDSEHKGGSDAERLVQLPALPAIRADKYDSMPYVDTQISDPAVKAQVRALVDEGMSSNRRIAHSSALFCAMLSQPTPRNAHSGRSCREPQVQEEAR